MADTGSTPTPPYGPWKTFKSYLGKLKATVIPPVIDPSVMPGYSGSAKSELRTGLRFLGAIDDDGKVTPKLKELVAAYDTSDFKQVLNRIVSEAYRPITENVDLNAATFNQLADAFRSIGKVEGSVLAKALRFYLSALDEAGISHSPHFKVRGAAVTNGSSRRSRAKTNSRTSGRVAAEDDTEPDETELPPPPGLRRFRLPLPSGADAVLHLPDKMEAADWKIIDTYIRSFFKLGGK